MSRDLVLDLFAGLRSPGRRLPKGWTHKACPGCGVECARAEFGTQSRCRACRREYGRKPSAVARRRAYYEAHREQAIGYSLKWKRANLDRWKDSNRKSKYGIPHGTYAELLAQQGGGCAICGTPEQAGKSLHVDHDHKTSRVRGLLCDLCNRGIGYFADDPTRLRAAAEYLGRAR